MEKTIEHPINQSAVVINGSSVVLWTFNVPQFNVLRFKRTGNYTGTPAAWGTIYWSFLVNGIPKFPLDKIMDEIGYGAQPADVEPIEIFGGDKLEIVAYNPSFGADVKMGIAFVYELYPAR